MIRVKFLVGNRQHAGFEIKGHAEFADIGEDIVCASVSSAAFMAANTVTEIIGTKADATADNGAMSLIIHEPCERTEMVLKGLEFHLKELSKQYPDNIKIIYGGVKNA